MTHKQVFIAAFVDFGDLVSVGYPLSVIYIAWNAGFSHDPMFYVGLKTLKRFLRSMPKIDNPWQISEHNKTILLNIFGISSDVAS